MYKNNKADKNEAKVHHFEILGMYMPTQSNFLFIIN